MAFYNWRLSTDYAGYNANLHQPLYNFRNKYLGISFVRFSNIFEYSADLYMNRSHEISRELDYISFMKRTRNFFYN